MLRSFCCWLLNNGIALSRNRACAALDQFAIFKCELLHVSHSLDDEMDHLQAVFFVCAWAVRLYTLADGVLTMTDSKSAPVRSLSTGEKILHKMRDGDDAAACCKAADDGDLPDAAGRRRRRRALEGRSAIRRGEWLKDISTLCGNYYRVLRRARPARGAIINFSP
jgi:hypothetical protein